MKSKRGAGTPEHPNDEDGRAAASRADRGGEPVTPQWWLMSAGPQCYGVTGAGTPEHPNGRYWPRLSRCKEQAVTVGID